MKKIKLKKKYWFLTILFILFLFSCSPKPPYPTITINDKDLDNKEVFIKDWQIIGPFYCNSIPFVKDTFNSVMDFNYLSLFDLTEDNLSSNTLMDLKIKNNDKSGIIRNNFIIKNIQSETQYISLCPLFGLSSNPEHNTCCYGSCIISSNIDQDITIILGSDDGIKIWLNNKLILMDHTGSMRRNQNIVKVHLNKGNNLLLAKICNLVYGWYFYASLNSLKSAKNLYHYKYHSNFIKNPIILKNDSLSVSIDGAFFSSNNVLFKIFNNKGVKVIDKSIPLYSGWKEPLHTFSNGIYLCKLIFPLDTLEQKFIVGNNDSIVNNLEKRAKKYYLNEKAKINLEALFYRYSHLKKYGIENGYDTYLERKMVSVISELESIVCNLEQNKEAFINVNGNHIRGYVSNIDGQVQHYMVCIPKNYGHTIKSLPIVIIMPWVARVKRQFLDSWHLADINLVELYNQLADKYGYAILWPNSRTYDRFNFFPWYNTATFEAINAVKRDYNIDTTRIYLTGFCYGGASALHFASRYPHLIAAVGIEGPAIANNNVSKSWAQLNNPLKLTGNFRNIPVYIIHGENDNVAPIEGSIKFSNLLKKNNGDIRLETLPGIDKRDDVVFYPIENDLDSIFSFFHNKKANLSPDTVTFVTSENKYNKAYWIKILKMEQYKRNLINARIELNNIIKVESENILSILE